MLFTEPSFLFVFLPALLALHCVPGPRYRNWLLLAASVAFYAFGAGAFTWLVLASLAANYAAARWIDALRGRPAGHVVLAATVALNLAVLVFFKYAAFLVTSVNAVLDAAGWGRLPVPAIVLPIGISFFTFHAISYVVDVYRRDAVAQKSPVEAALYLLLFPQLIAGPIVRYRDMAHQLRARAVALPDLAFGVRRFVIGFGKKMLVANVLAGTADQIFAMPPATLTAGHAWLGVTCYTLQIYFDFSGYSDMAIGLARLFGFHFPENFDYPYVARSVQEFWRRWHLSLSTWFRDYVYVPLGGNRVGPRRMYLNLCTVFLLCGLWHGASWTFVVWGVYHGAFLVIERLVRGEWTARLPKLLGHVYAMLVVMVSWVFFRAESLAAAGGMLRAMAGMGGDVPTPFSPSWYLTPEVGVALVAGVVGATPLWPTLARWLSDRASGAAGDTAVLGWRSSAAVVVALALVFTGGVMLVAARTYNPFIYFRF